MTVKSSCLHTSYRFVCNRNDVYAKATATQCSRRNIRCTQSISVLIDIMEAGQCQHSIGITHVYFLPPCSLCTVLGYSLHYNRDLYG